LDIRKNFFKQRVVKNWNSIPREIKCAKNVAGFKAAYKSMHRTGQGGRPNEQRADETEVGTPPASTDGPLMPPKKALGFYLQVTSK
jgi:hypothetical protein